MTPDSSRVLQQSAGRLLFEMAPMIGTPYAQGTLSLIALLMIMAAQDAAQGANVRAADNADMCKLFGALLPLVTDDALKRKLAAAMHERDASLDIAALDRLNAELRAMLIALHAHVEDLPGEPARAAEKQIWGVMKASAARRLLKLPAM